MTYGSFAKIQMCGSLFATFRYFLMDILDKNNNNNNKNE